MTTLYREQWEEPGYRIADHTNSPPVNPAELRYTVNHYPAAKTIGADPVAWFRAAQRAWVIERGYSLGYGWGYWPDGREVEVRGWDYRNAANDVPDHPGDENRRSVAFLLVVPGLRDAGQPATPAQVAAVQRRLADVHARAGRPLPNLVHGDLERTACAGAGVNRQTALGLFLPPIPDEEDTDMKPVITTWAGEGDPILVAYDPATCTYLWRGIADPDALVAAGLAVRGTGVLTQAQKANTAVYRRMG